MRVIIPPARQTHQQQDSGALLEKSNSQDDNIRNYYNLQRAICGFQKPWKVVSSEDIELQFVNIAISNSSFLLKDIQSISSWLIYLHFHSLR